MINQKTDEILTENILNGKNNEAENILFERYKKIVKTYLKQTFYKYLNNSNNSDIDDDVCEILAKIFLNLNKYDANKSKFKSWAITISKNHMLNKQKVKKTIATCDYQSYSYLTSDTLDALNYTCNCLSNISANPKFEENSTLTYISSQISPNDYKMLDMKYNQGYDYNEIGNFFNTTSSTISNRVNYLKSKLKKENPEIIYEY